MHLVLTIKLSVPGSQRVNQKGATVLHQTSEGGFSFSDKLLLCLTGTAGVFLGADLQVLTWTEEAGMAARDIMKFLSSTLYLWELSFLFYRSELFFFSFFFSIVFLLVPT